MKNCKKCGGEAKVLWTTMGPYIQCSQCGEMTSYYPTENEAVENWNKGNYVWSSLEKDLDKLSDNSLREIKNLINLLV